MLQKRFATLIFLGIFLKAMPARLTRAMISWKLRACRSRCTSWMMAAAVGDPLEDRELLPGLGAATRLHHGFGSRVASVGTYSETTAVLRPSRSFHKPRSSSASSTPIAPTSPCSSTAPPRGPAWSAKSEKKWGG